MRIQKIRRVPHPSGASSGRVGSHAVNQKFF
jgi:hypothetical protein